MAFLEGISRWLDLFFIAGLGLAMVIIVLYLIIIKIKTGELGIGSIIFYLFLMAIGIFLFYIGVSAFLDNDFWCENFSGVTRLNHCFDY